MDQAAKTSSDGLRRLAAALAEKRALAITPDQKRIAEARNAIRFEFDGAPDTALFSDSVAAVVLGTTTSVLALWRAARKGPNWVRVGKAPKYEKGELVRFIRYGERK